MHKAIIADTSCLILLERIQSLFILESLYGEIVITPEIATEYGLPLPEWVSIQTTTSEDQKTVLRASLDLGEASAIALALELNDCLLILDDLKGKKMAELLGFATTGSLGIIVRAKANGVIPAVRPLLERIKSTNFRMTEQLEQVILKSAGEL